MVDWTTIVKNSKYVLMLSIFELHPIFNRCVDKYFLWIWPDGTQKTSPSTKKIEIPKSTTSKIVDVEPCVSYRYSVVLLLLCCGSTNNLDSLLS